MTTVLWRECRECGQRKPETREHWRIYSGKIKGRLCNKCSNARNRKYAASPEVREYYRKRNAIPEARERKREYNRKYAASPEARERRRERYARRARADHRAMYNDLPPEERGPVLRQILSEHRWHALRDRQPHIVYCYSKGAAQYVGITWRDVYQRLQEHCERDESACYEWLADGVVPLVEVLHHCDNRADAFALEAQEISERHAAGITLLNRIS